MAEPVVTDLSGLKVLTEGAPADAVVADVDRRGAGDGLPLVTPTGERVAAMLAGWAPVKEITPLPPLMLRATAEDVAVCAVLAGCRPGCLPYVMGALDAAVAPEFNLLGVATTTGNAAIGVILHGPGAVRLGAAAGPNCLGPSKVNTAIGRAVGLACRLLGGAVAGALDMATVGQPAKLSLCFAEATTPSGWPTLHAARGSGPGTDAVTVFSAAGIVEVADAWSESASGLLETLAAATPLPAAISADGEMLGGGQQVYVLPPEWVARLVTDGWTHDAAGEFLYDHAVLPIHRLPPSAQSRLTEQARAAGFVRTARAPADFLFVCAGGPGIKAAYLPSWPGGSIAVTRSLP